MSGTSDGVELHPERAPSGGIGRVGLRLAPVNWCVRPYGIEAGPICHVIVLVCIAIADHGLVENRCQRRLLSPCVKRHLSVHVYCITLLVVDGHGSLIGKSVVAVEAAVGCGLPLVLVVAHDDIRVLHALVAESNAYPVAEGAVCAAPPAVVHIGNGECHAQLEVI